MKAVSEPYRSASGGGAKHAETLEFSPPEVGQNCPQDYPHVGDKPRRRNPGDQLGEALSIADVAELLGCSVWTVRKKCLPRGLPHFRIGTTGKLVFYRAQVTRWILEQQELYRGRR
jgi:hypothetical protein